MFLCKECIPIGFDRHFSYSHGSCEDCGKVALCADCHCPAGHPAPDTRHVESKSQLKRKAVQAQARRSLPTVKTKPTRGS